MILPASSNRFTDSSSVIMPSARPVKIFVSILSSFPDRIALAFGALLNMTSNANSRLAPSRWIRHRHGLLLTSVPSSRLNSTVIELTVAGLQRSAGCPARYSNLTEVLLESPVCDSRVATTRLRQSIDGASGVYNGRMRFESLPSCSSKHVYRNANACRRQYQIRCQCRCGRIGYLAPRWTSFLSLEPPSSA